MSETLTEKKQKKPLEQKRINYEEWYVKIHVSEKKVNGEKIISRRVEKLKMVERRDNVMINDDQAAILNIGILHGYSTEPKMYYLPNAEQPTLPEEEA